LLLSLVLSLLVLSPSIVVLLLASVAEPLLS
jgi:hypothetical protein